MQQPHLILNWAAIAVSVLAAFIFGGLWFGPIMGKTWAKELGVKMDKKPSGAFMARAYGLYILGTFLTAYVLAHTCQVWRPSVWGVGQDAPAHIYGFFCGFFTWIGFYIPMQFGRVSWENKSWKLFFINTTYDFVSLQIISQILAYWR